MSGADSKMGIVSRAALVVLQFLVFLVVTGFSAKAISHLNAREYGTGDAPAGSFPVVAADPRAKFRYELVQWEQIDKFRQRNPQATFRLAESAGRFALPLEGEFEPSVSFRVLEATATGQHVEVTWKSDDREIVSRYTTDGAVVRPAYFRAWGAANVLVGIVPGLLVAWLLGWSVRRASGKARARGLSGNG